MLASNLPFYFHKYHTASAVKTAICHNVHLHFRRYASRIHALHKFGGVTSIFF